ncbi:DUF1345 domain-containing protein [Pseudonocardia sp. ICBG1293]|uniref:DUF1345 domain-containing protein n=1 Tax=Pseudonocardia sp. ICBG1293 TaxID=2844382 RepID=UPI001CCE29C4|nr:DUF1345 domain-containing protein [Pseudonocardia sp. ICBG1293]
MPVAPSDPARRGGVPSPGRAGARSGDDLPGSRRPRLSSDTARYLLTSIVTAVLAACYGVVAAVEPAGVGSLRFVVVVYFGTWCVHSLLYAGLTWAVLRRADGAELREWLREDPRGRRRRRRTEWLAGSAGPHAAVWFCAAAIGAVVAASVLPQLRDDPLVVVLAVLVVASTWLLITIVYAVHYARENAHRGGLEFRGVLDEGPPQLADYLYLSVQIGTAYNGAEVTVTSRAMRRTAGVHTVVAFVFNTVLIALLVSLLVAVAP